MLQTAGRGSSESLGTAASAAGGDLGGAAGGRGMELAMELYSRLLQYNAPAEEQVCHHCALPHMHMLKPC